MSVSKKALKENNYKLKGSLKKGGFDRWRYVFNATNVSNRDESNFFIELTVLNPAVSPDKAIMYDSVVEKIGGNDLQAALTGNINVEKPLSSIVPSYCCIRCGILGRKPRQLVRYFACDEFSSQKNVFDLKLCDCTFSDSDLFGSLTVTKEDLRRNPQSKSNAGRMVWNLKYKRIFDAAPVVAKNTLSWFATGVNAEYSGTITFDGVEYVVSPETSFGYTDKTWGVEMPFPFLHISSSRLISVFTGSIMKNSGFTLEGDFDGRTVVVAKFDNDEITFGKSKKIKKFSSLWSCVRTPSGSGSEELHWSVSFNSKKYILDVDVFCNATEMIVKDYDMPQGEGTILRVLGSASANGEIRLYRQVGKSLEPIQHAKIMNAVAEYGVKDIAEN